MNKKIAIGIVAGFVGAILAVVLLAALSRAVKNTPGSFLREYPSHPVEEDDSLNLKYDSYYIAGGTPYTLYLGNSNAPFHVLEVNIAKLDTHHHYLRIKGALEQKFYSPRVQIDSPYFYFTDGTVPVLFKGDISTGKGDRYMSDSIYFQNILPVKPGLFALQSLSGRTHENILGKLTEWPPYRTFTDSILQKQLDGVFCTEGMFRYDKLLNKLVYLYSYRNEFMVMDTSLQLQYRGHTIDTTTRAKIRTGRIESDRTNTLASPPYLVNKRMDASGRWMFVHSALLARNEHPDTFANGAAIDLYNLENGRYAFSFYIYHFNNRTKLSEFRVFGNTMVVRFGHVIQKFRLKPEYFEVYGLAEKEATFSSKIFLRENQD